MSKRKTKKGGFTLIEFLVVISIIGVLTTLGIVSFIVTRNKANTTKAEADLKQIRTAIDMLALDTDEWPGHQQVDFVCNGCSNNELCSDDPQCADSLYGGYGGVTQDDSAPDEYPGWSGPYIVNIPLDPWKNEYFFDTDYDIDESVGEDWKAVIGSYGPNGEGYNDYDTDDIILIIAQ